MNQSTDFLSISDFLVVLIKRWRVFFLTFVVVMGLAAAYAFLAKKTYELTGTVCVGKFQGELLEEGEFVAQKLEDYSFIKRAVEQAGIDLDVSVMRLQKLIKTELVNEVKKTKDVGLVQVNVRYKDRDKVVEIFEAITDQLIAQHQVLLDQAVSVLRDQEGEYRQLQAKLQKSIDEDESLSVDNRANAPNKTVPSLLLLEHTLSEKRVFRSMLTKNIHEVRVEAESATQSYNTKLAAAPQPPDAHLKPKLTLTLILGFILAVIAATAASYFWNLLVLEIVPRVRES